MTLYSAIDEICGDNIPAKDFCLTFYEWCHLLDDLYDQDKKRTADSIADGLIKIMALGVTNPFWIQHHAQLLPVIHVSARAWAASEHLKTSEDPQKQVAAEVVKSDYQNVFFYVAFLLHGPEFAAEMDRKYRSYSFG